MWWIGSTMRRLCHLLAGSFARNWWAWGRQSEVLKWTEITLHLASLHCPLQLARQTRERTFNLSGGLWTWTWTWRAWRSGRRMYIESGGCGVWPGCFRVDLVHRSFTMDGETTRYNLQAPLEVMREATTAVGACTRLLVFTMTCWGTKRTLDLMPSYFFPSKIPTKYLPTYLPT